MPQLSPLDDPETYQRYAQQAAQPPEPEGAAELAPVMQQIMQGLAQIFPQATPEQQQAVEQLFTQAVQSLQAPAQGA